MAQNPLEDRDTRKSIMTVMEEFICSADKTNTQFLKIVNYFERAPQVLVGNSVYK